MPIARNARRPSLLTSLSNRFYLSGETPTPAQGRCGADRMLGGKRVSVSAGLARGAGQRAGEGEPVCLALNPRPGLLT
jgi:hypothetical protein